MVNSSEENEKNKKNRANDNLRHAECYDMQKVYDELYARAKQNEGFDSLKGLIISRDNILLAYRNIKTNT